jgi:hypothetical protein
VFSKVVNKTAKTQNYGKSILTLFTAVPTTSLIDTNGDTVGDKASVPNECKDTGVLTLAFPAVIESTNREVTTDEAISGKNTGLTADPDGAGVRDTADTYADDWDGDGCTDWDELDKNFSGSFPVSVTGPVNGTDPFNPNDCDQNLDSTLSIFTTVIHDTSNAGLGTGGGQYFKCIADASDPKGGGTRTITLRLGCYSDSTVTVVNSSYIDVPYDAGRHEGGGAGPATCNDTLDNDSNGKTDANDSSCHVTTCIGGGIQAPPSMCGDGKAGGSPPSAVCRPTAGDCTGAFVGIDTDQYPVVTTATCASTPPSNCFNKGTNTLSIGGCFAGLGGPTFGPNVYGSGSFDTRVGAGSFTIRIGITDETDCQNGPPFADGTDIVGTATYVELGSKKTLAGVPIPASLHKNSDKDGCSDTQELRSGAAAEKKGGYRDPYNSYDYFNPTGDGLDRVDDILAVVNQYFQDDPAGDIDYASLTDRTAVPGANTWNLGPPNGQQRVDDILAIVKQYFHDCKGPADI